MGVYSSNVASRLISSGISTQSSAVAPSPYSVFEHTNKMLTSRPREKATLGSTPRPDSSRDASTSQLTIGEMVNLAFHYEQECSPFSTIVTNLVNYAFRNGFTWQPRFTVKCNRCQREYDDNVEVCDCGSQSFREPDVHQQEAFSHKDGTSFLDKANENGMSLLALCKLAERHRTVADNHVWVLQKSYLFNDDGSIAIAALKQVIPVDPRDMEKLHDPYGRMGQGDRICLIHRQPTRSLTCPKCNLPTHPAFYRTRNTKQIYYAEHEVIWTSEYNPQLIYGYPEIMRASNIVNAIINIDWRFRDYYENVNLPSIVGVTSQSQDTLSSNLAKLVEQKQMYPSLPVFISLGENGKIEQVKLMENPNPEMWELRRRAVLDIASKFNFPALLLNDMADAGGLNVESEQYAMWAQKIEQVRHDFEQSALSPLLACFPSITDWKLCIAREDDDATIDELRVLQMQANVMQTLTNIGFDVEFRNQEIIISDTIVHDRTPPQDFFMSKDANFGVEDANRDPLFTPDQEEAFLLDLYDRQFLSEQYDVIAPILLAEARMRGLFTTLDEAQVSQLYDIIIQRMSDPSGWTLQQIRDAVSSEFNLTPSEAMTIARTEANRVATTTREVYATANDPPEATYTWVGATDHRTTPICREIKRRVKEEGGGVTLPRLKDIVRDVGTEYAVARNQSPPPTDWTPHINCRHTFRRVWL